VFYYELHTLYWLLAELGWAGQRVWIGIGIGSIVCM